MPHSCSLHIRCSITTNWSSRIIDNCDAFKIQRASSHGMNRTPTARPALAFHRQHRSSEVGVEFLHRRVCAPQELMVLLQPKANTCWSVEEQTRGLPAAARPRPQELDPAAGFQASYGGAPMARVGGDDSHHE
uniref:Uncharacterized protein n=1 Tax=Arundo donax TaxID=35708 RepID=A0A0A9ALF1_ARUDO